MNYSHDNWSAILAHIGKPEELDTSARNAGALTRRREIRDAATLLRLGLAYGPGGMSLREVTAWAQLHDVATLSDVALLKRLRNAADWFGILAAQTLATLIKDPCNKCHGHGRVERSKTLSVKIPAGVDTGDRIRLAGEGEAGEHGAPAGDLYVQVQVKQHPIFEREGNNLYCEVPINFAMAALGGEIEVPTLDGRVKLKVPGETQTGKLFRMRGKGVKSVRGGAQGDLLCRVVVETPVGLNERQKQLLQELQESFGGPTGEHNSPRSKSFFDGVKKFFDDLTR